MSKRKSAPTNDEKRAEKHLKTENKSVEVRFVDRLASSLSSCALVLDLSIGRKGAGRRVLGRHYTARSIGAGIHSFCRSTEHADFSSPPNVAKMAASIVSRRINDD